MRSWYCKDCDVKTILVDDMGNITCTNCGKKMMGISDCKHFLLKNN